MEEESGYHVNDVAGLNTPTGIPQANAEGICVEMLPSYIQSIPPTNRILLTTKEFALIQQLHQ